jgi:hypothetical protein
MILKAHQIAWLGNDGKLKDLKTHFELGPAPYPWLLVSLTLFQKLKAN